MTDDLLPPGRHAVLLTAARSIVISSAMVLAYYLLPMDAPLNVGTVTGLVGPDLDMLDTCHEISSLSVLIARPIRRRAVWTKPLEQTAAQGQPGENRGNGNRKACQHVNGRQPERAAFE